jgi:VCBS repeat-containing protein
LDNDSDPDGDLLTVARLVLEGTKGSAAIGTGGAIRYRAAATADNASAGGAAGDSFGYVVADGHGGEATARVTISIVGVETQPSLEQFLQDHSPAIVWLGGEGQGLKIPLCTGFAVSPTKVVSTAREISQLAGFQQKGHRIFAYQASPTPTFIGVTNMAVHPRYDRADPGSAASRLHNVGVVTLEHPLPKTMRLVQSDEIRSSIAGATITVMGFAIPEGDDAKAYDRLNPPRMVQRTGTIRETRPLPGADDLPLLVLDVEVVAGMDGAPLILDDGKVLGLLLRSGGTRYGILSDRIVMLIQ